VVSYFLGFISDPFLFILFFPVASLSILLSIFFSIFLFLKRIDTKEIYTILLFCVFYFALGIWVINHFLPDRFYYISILGDNGSIITVSITIFTIFLGWSLIRTHKGKIIVIVASQTFVLSIFLLASITLRNDKQDKPSSIDILKTIPYLSFVVEDKAPDKDGVIIDNQNSSYDGINIYNSQFKQGAYLMDMSGNILHTWLPKKSPQRWEYVKVNNDGDLFVSINDEMLMKLDWNSNIVWKKNIRSHHDIAIDENKKIYTLSRKDELVFISCLPVPILNDYIVVLSPNGKIEKEISLFKVLKKQIPLKKILGIYIHIMKTNVLFELIKQKVEGLLKFDNDTPFDIFHNNTITIMNSSMNGFYNKGDILISVRQLDLIGIVNVDKEKLLWSWGPGNLDMQHHPTQLENGNLMIFDNGVRKRNYSRIVEIDPLTKEIIWLYKSNPPTLFYTNYGGAAQRLPNGNTLITETAQGRVFEITKDGEIVWEFYNPAKTENGKWRLAIYRMMRIVDLENYPFLKELQ
jgi:hypothetical protein